MPQVTAGGSSAHADGGRRPPNPATATYRLEAIAHARQVRTRCAQVRESLAARRARSQARKESGAPSPDDSPGPVVPSGPTPAMGQSTAALVLEMEHGLRMARSLVRGWATLLDTRWDTLAEPVRREGVATIRRRGEDIVEALESLLERAHAVAPPADGGGEKSDGDEHRLRPAEAARMLAVSAKTVVRSATEGRLSSTLTPGGHHRFSRDEVLRVADEMQGRRGDPGGRP